MSFATSPHDSPRRALLIGWLRYTPFIWKLLSITSPPRTISGPSVLAGGGLVVHGAHARTVCFATRGPCHMTQKVAFEGHIGYHSPCTYTDIGHSWGVGPISVWPLFISSLERI